MSGCENCSAVVWDGKCDYCNAKLCYRCLTFDDINNPIYSKLCESCATDDAAACDRDFLSDEEYRSRDSD